LATRDHEVKLAALEYCHGSLGAGRLFDVEAKLLKRTASAIIQLLDKPRWTST